MERDNVVLCGASAYTKKYYLKPQFTELPEGVRQELQILCVLYTEDVGGFLTLVFDEDGNLHLEAGCDDEDLLYDEIGSVLKIKQIQRERTELLESLEIFYKVVFLGEDFDGEDENG